MNLAVDPWTCDIDDKTLGMLKKWDSWKLPVEFSFCFLPV